MTITLAIVIVIAIGVLVYTNLPYSNQTSDDTSDMDTTDENEQNENDETLLTIIHKGINYTYSISELENIEPYTAPGRYIKTKLLPDTVILGDTHNYTGVTIQSLLDDVNVSSNFYQLNISASDGWITTYSINDTIGKVDVYDETGQIIDNASATMIIAYKEDRKYYSTIDLDNEIGPLRIAFVGENTPITPSNLWAKMITTIEVIYLS
ncbi:MAG: hypothetical protein R6U21_02465 [Thermoplasmatota archaeon]